MKKDTKWGLNFISSLNPAKYNYVSNIEDLIGDNSVESPNKMFFGVMAQDIENYIESLGENPKNFNMLKYNNNGYMSVNYIELIGPMIRSIQELKEEIQKLKEEIQKLKEEIQN